MSQILSECVKAQCPTRHFVGYFGDNFYRSDDPTNNAEALKGEQKYSDSMTHFACNYDTNVSSYLLIAAGQCLLPCN